MPLAVIAQAITEFGGICGDMGIAAFFLLKPLFSTKQFSPVKGRLRHSRRLPVGRAPLSTAPMVLLLHYKSIDNK